MPWTENDAHHKTRHANTARKRTKWANIANGVLEKSGDEGKAIRIANAAVHPRTHKKPK